jgi:cyclophilin family peptidyl-prolyl cis-trans isomerase/HEAT repeat protein
MSIPGAPRGIGALVGVVACVLAALGAVAALAQDPGSFEARAEYLLRRMDAGLLPTSMMIAMLGDPFAESRVFAMRAAASSSDPSQTLLLAEYLRDRDFRVRYGVMIAAGRLGEAGRELAFRGLRDDIPKVRQAAAWAACHGGADALEPLIAWLPDEPDLGVRSTALANLWRFEEGGWEAVAVSAAASDEAQIRRAAAYSLSRSPLPAARSGLRRLAADPEPVIRATALAGLRRAPLTEEDLAILIRSVNDDDPRVRRSACLVLAERSAPSLPVEAAQAVARLWRPTDAQTAALAIRAAGLRPEIGPDAGLLLIASGEDPWLAAEAFVAAVRRGVASTEKIAKAWLASGDVWRRRAVAAVAASLGAEKVKAVVADAEPAVRLAWIESLGESDVEGSTEILRRLLGSDPDPAVRTAALHALTDAGAAMPYDAALALAESWRSDELPDARAAALVAALAAAATDAQRTRVIERAAADPDPAVGVMVVNAARSAGLPAKSLERTIRHNRKWYVDLVDWMQDQHWLDVVTDRGTFRIRLESLEAPISSRELYDLAEAGFYDGLSFHRVVPNFVVQAGDPRGDGWGGAGFVLADEPVYRPFDTGRVGIATSGPNTGSGQFFVTLAPADHLVGHYTNVGDVVIGREVLGRLQLGDRIRRIEVASGDEPAPPSPTLVGRVTWPDLETIPGWLEEYDAASPDPAAVDRLASAAGSYRIVTVLGTWCGDSRREVPRLLRVLDEIGRPIFEHEMIAVDRTRRIDDPDLATAAGVERTVERVATIVVFDAEGQEIGRIVETAQAPLETLLVEFIAPAEGWR